MITVHCSLLTDIGFAGQRYDSDLNLWNFRARYYDDFTGSFISRDPLGDVDGPSEYNGYFAGGLSMDPTGLTPKLDNPWNAFQRRRKQRGIYTTPGHASMAYNKYKDVVKASQPSITPTRSQILQVSKKNIRDMSKFGAAARTNAIGTTGGFVSSVAGVPAAFSYQYNFFKGYASDPSKAARGQAYIDYNRTLDKHEREGCPKDRSEITERAKLVKKQAFLGNPADNSHDRNTYANDFLASKYRGLAEDLRASLDPNYVRNESYINKPTYEPDAFARYRAFQRNTIDRAKSYTTDKVNSFSDRVKSYVNLAKFLVL